MSVYETLERVMVGDGTTLKLKCGACGHQDAWSRKRAIDTLGPDAVPYLIRRRLVCGACFSRGRTEVWI
jgi:hypothetical protein